MTTREKVMHGHVMNNETDAAPASPPMATRARMEMEVLRGGDGEVDRVVAHVMRGSCC